MSLEYIPLLCLTDTKGWLQSSLYKTKYNIHAKIITKRKHIFLSGIIKHVFFPLFSQINSGIRALGRGSQSSPPPLSQRKKRNEEYLWN